MLEKFTEKSTENSYFDSHFHYAQCKKLGICDFPDNWSGISCAHSKEEWQNQQTAPKSVLQCYGIHPQFCVKFKGHLCGDNEKSDFLNECDFLSECDFLEKLSAEGKIVAIGEAGFDFFTQEFKSSQKKQEEAWNIQLELAKKYSLPLVIHCRKANEKLFEYSRELSKLCEVLFHSFMESYLEGLSLLNRGINGYFSFGKQVFNNNKHVIECVKKLPNNRVFAETDAPFQFLKGETYTQPKEIIKITEEIKKLQM